MSYWTEVEFGSLLARDVRMGNMQVETARMILDLFWQDMEGAYQVLTPTEADFREATRLLLPQTDVRTGLRGPDALHLAIVKNRDLLLYTLDQPLLRAAQTLGIPASDAGIGAR